MFYTIAWLNLMVAMLPHFTLCWPSVQWKIMYFEALVLLLIEQKAILGIELTFTTITLALIKKKTHYPLLYTHVKQFRCITCPSRHQTAQVCTVQKVKVKNWTWMFLFSYTSLAAMGLFKPPLNPTPTEILQKLVQNGRPGLERALPIWHLFNRFLSYYPLEGGEGSNWHTLFVNVYHSQRIKSWNGIST